MFPSFDRPSLVQYEGLDDVLFTGAPLLLLTSSTMECRRHRRHNDGRGRRPSRSRRTCGACAWSSTPTSIGARTASWCLSAHGTRDRTSARSPCGAQAWGSLVGRQKLCRAPAAAQCVFMNILSHLCFVACVPNPGCPGHLVLWQSDMLGEVNRVSLRVNSASSRGDGKAETSKGFTVDDVTSLPVSEVAG